MTHRLYAINAYNTMTKDQIENNYEKYNLILQLKNDHGYHMRIRADGTYVFFGDCDKFGGSYGEFANILIEFLRSRYNIIITFDDIQYTRTIVSRVVSLFCIKILRQMCQVKKNT